MGLGEVLRHRKDAIAERWLDAALLAYPQEGAAAFRSQRDPFANPVGHALRTGIRGILDALLEETDEPDVRGHLKGILSIRAVQDLSASQALGFLFELRRLLRAELEAAPGAAGTAQDLAALDRRIDQVALAGFEVYAQCREQLSQLRINEVKRQVPWIAGRMAARKSPDGPGEAEADPGASTQVFSQQEGER